MTTREKLLEQYTAWLQVRKYASATIKTYVSTVRCFYDWCEQEQLQNLHFDKNNAAFAYLSSRAITHTSGSLNSDYSALKLLYEKVLNRPWSFDKIPRARKSHHLPEVLSNEEVELIVSCAHTHRNQVLLLLIYQTGMRLGEISRLRIHDIESDKMAIRVRSGKGDKDRYVYMTDDVLQLLRNYYRAERPKDYFFEGEKPRTPLSTRMIQHIFYEAKAKAGIFRQVSVHTLRHAFATHLIEANVNPAELQALLGHTNLKTTMRYVHLATDSYKRLPNLTGDMCDKIAAMWK
jgi:integrase/recombinase XerD